MFFSLLDQFIQMRTHSILNYNLYQMLQDFTPKIYFIFTAFHSCGTKSYLKSTEQRKNRAGRSTPSYLHSLTPLVLILVSFCNWLLFFQLIYLETFSISNSIGVRLSEKHPWKRCCNMRKLPHLYQNEFLMPFYYIVWSSLGAPDCASIIYYPYRTDSNIPIFDICRRWKVHLAGSAPHPPPNPPFLFPHGSS